VVQMSKPLITYQEFKRWYRLKKWEELTIRKQFRFKNQGFTRKDNVGLDTETYQGYVKLICDSYRRYKFIESFDDLLNFMTFKNYRDKFCWFFNLKYDFDSIIKYLDVKELLTLYETKKLEYNKISFPLLADKYDILCICGIIYDTYYKVNFLLVYTMPLKDRY